VKSFPKLQLSEGLGRAGVGWRAGGERLSKKKKREDPTASQTGKNGNAIKPTTLIVLLEKSGKKS